MMWSIGLPPKDTVVALVVRKWVACRSGLRTSFLARDPVLHISALGQAFANLEFEPTQTVCMGSLVEKDGELIVLDEDGDEAGYEATAILAWSPVPSFALDQAAAAETDLLLRRMADVAR
ncbi:MAG: hypothetical protein N2690_11250 [Rhodocyclaceae bacterium]|nr:hypothetical protein [Rhodocyclaceae bacterium]